ncbi:MAG: hypothetical protein ACRERE_11880 [Candidatus Entotheonellia bacterium]
MSEDYQFQTRINPSWLAAVRVASPRLRITTPFPLMNLVAREKGVTATIEGQVLVLTVGPGTPPSNWPWRHLDLLAILQRCADAASMLEAIRTAQPVVNPPTTERAGPRAAKKTRLARAPKSTARPSKTPPVVSVPLSNMLTTARPEEVWAAIRERQGEPFTVDELQATLGASVGPYVMMWARDGYLIKADRDPSPNAPWRYRLLRDDSAHPPVG